jgi:uncharacterized YigZ family protein
MMKKEKQELTPYYVPLHEIRNEITIVKSRFITTLTPVVTLEEAKTFIARIQKEFFNATHNVSAYCIGHNLSKLTHCSDDGEPPGSAGRPALAALNGSGLCDVAVVVTRYFGGSRLGIAGLVKAYSDSVRHVTEMVPRATRTMIFKVQIVLPYNYLDRVRLLIKTHKGVILSEVFSEKITLQAQFPENNINIFKFDLSELTSNKIIPEIIERGFALIPIHQE